MGSQAAWGALLMAGAAILCSVPQVRAAADMPVEITLSEEIVEVGDSVELGLLIQNATGVPAPQLPAIDGVKAQYLGPSTMMSFVNGKMNSSITHRYALVIIKPGTVTIGPFSFTHQGTQFNVPQRTLTVVARGQPLPASATGDSEQSPGAGVEERIFLRVIPEKETAFVNERVPVLIKAYINQLSVQDVQYPVMEATGFVHEGFDKPRQNREAFSGQYYEVITFRTAISATREGPLTLENISLRCTILARQDRRASSSPGAPDLFDDSFFNNFFGRYQSFPLQVDAPAVTLSILPFPLEGKPVDFKGAVGMYDLNVQVNPREVAAGDPVTLRMEVSGTGNLDSITSPGLSDAAQFKVYQPESRREGQLRVFEQVIIPQTEQVREIPAVLFSFFDPELKQYVTRRQGPFTLHVTPAAEKKATVVDAPTPGLPGAPARTEILGRDIIFIKQDPGALRPQRERRHAQPIIWFIHILPLAGLAAAGIYRRRQDRLRQDIRYARKLRAPRIARQGLKKIRQLAAAGNTTECYDMVSKTLREYLGHRFNRSSAGITIAMVEELVSRQEMDEGLGKKLKQCFSECDTARYAPATIDAGALEYTRAMVEEIIDAMERSRR